MCIVPVLMMALIGSAAVESRDASRLQEAVRRAVDRATTVYGPLGLGPDQLAVSVRTVGTGADVSQADHRGNVGIYPASVVKLFYLVAAQQWMEDGRLAPTPELDRALRDMIVDSSNDATHYVVDLLTGTTGGPELAPGEMEAWVSRRNAVNRYFAERGLAGINVNQKPWCEGPYGRERQFLGLSLENRNALTTNATARLLAEIAEGRAVSAGRSAAMRALLARDPARDTTDPDSQDRAFTGAALPAGSRLWSKAGWTSTTRHDAAYVELPSGERVVVVIFTTGVSQHRDIVPGVAQMLLEEFGRR